MKLPYQTSVSAKGQGPIQSGPVDCLLLNAPDLPTRYPYLGIALLAGMLRANGISVAILDSAALGMTIGDVIRYINDLKPRIIGLSIMSLTLRSSYELVRAIHASYPEAVVVAGGAHINADPESVQTLDVPYGFIGECEHEFLDFCTAILGGKEPKETANLIVHKQGQLMIGERKIVDDLDTLPWPAMDLLPVERYYSPSTHLRTISFITSRGCPYDCIYCSKVDRIRVRSLSVENTVDQLEWLVKGLGIEWVEFVDEVFTLNRTRVVELCNAIIKRGLNFQWGCGSRADRIDEDLLVVMKKAGCRKIGFGIESGVERIRYLDRKRITNEQMKNAVSLCKGHGIKTQACFIFGHPTETLDEMKETVRFARNLGANYPSFSRMMPFPGSEVFEQAKLNGEVTPDVWKDFMLGHGPLPLYTPKGVTLEQVYRIFRRSWFEVYFWPPNMWNNRDVLMSTDYIRRAAKAFRDFALSRDY
jgi:anaerobic magnesium-protoporphyrin IX monomethyl ester cyclase